MAPFFGVVDMAKKAKVAKFRIQKRFTVWVEKEVSAETFEEAVELARKASPGEFFTFDSGGFLDYDELQGTGVYEAW